MVVLYNPRAAERHRRLPLSVMALAAALEGKRAWALVDGNLESDPLKRILSLLASAGEGAILAVTVMPGRQLELAAHHSREVRAALPQIPIVWGGYFPSDHSDVCLRAGYVDYVVRGNGEETLVALAAALDTKRDDAFARIEGLSWKSEGRARHNPARGISDPNDAPWPPYERVGAERYVARTYLGRRTLSHHSSFGCPFSCNFCSVVVTYQTRWKAETPERTVAIVRHLHQRYAIDGLEFHDNNFFVSEARTRAVAEGLRGLGISWWGEGRSDTLLRYSTKTWEAMRESGCRMIFTGAESGSDEKLRQMNKGGTQTGETILEAAKLFRAHGIVPEFSFVLGNPPDPAGDIRENIEFVRRIKRINPAAEIILYLYTPVPLPGLYDEAVAQGFRYPETLEEWVEGDWASFSRRRDPRTPWLTDAHRRLLADFETVLNARYPTATDLRLSRGWRRLLPILGAPRWRFGLFGGPVELRFLLRALRYRRPEVEGFPQELEHVALG